MLSSMPHLLLMSNTMKTDHRWQLMALLLIGSVVVGLAFGESKTSSAAAPPEENGNRSSEEPFDKMMTVLTHKRCVNCHPSDSYPRQGEDSHLHNFGVQRGADNHGVVALRCQTCHQRENNELSGVPGAPEWSLAPIQMAWQGLSRTEIARSILDPKINGGRTLDELVRHLTEHELVLWAWEPGVDANGNPRETPPVPKDEYIAAVKAWAAAGGPIPAQ